MKTYGGGTIISSFFESPKDRKRQGILDILSAFHESKFLVFGDSGEQDLELYLSIALERPSQILGIFIRDLSSARVKTAELTTLTTAPPSHRDDARPGFIHASSNLFDTANTLRSGDPSSFAHETVKNGLPSSPPSSPSVQKSGGILADLQELTAPQQKTLRRAARWDERVDTARRRMPAETRMVLFQHPEEISAVALDLVKQSVHS